MKIWIKKVILNIINKLIFSYNPYAFDSLRSITHINISLLILFCSSISTAQKLDIRTLERINLNRNTRLDNSFKAISNTTGLISFGLPLTILTVGYFNDHVYTKKRGWYLVEVALVNTAITTALKYSINRKRPFITYPYLIPLDKAKSPSFPSGHTSDAFALATSLSLSYPKWYIAAGAFTWAGAVGYSRMHLGVHYPSDVIGGAVVGAGSSWLCHYLNRKLFTR